MPWQFCASNLGVDDLEPVLLAPVNMVLEFFFAPVIMMLVFLAPVIMVLIFLAPVIIVLVFLAPVNSLQVSSSLSFYRKRI